MSCENKINFLCIVVRIFITLIRRDAIFFWNFKKFIANESEYLFVHIGE